MEGRRLFVLGGTGFIGSEVIREAVARGWEVAALARSEEKAARLRALGAKPVLGDARSPAAWIDRARGASLLVDLVQPALPARIGPRDIDAISSARQSMARELLACLRELAPGERPLLVSVSGTDDLAPDGHGEIHASSAVKTPPSGFGRIGVPVRRLVEGSGLPFTLVYLGTVYGPGKSFASTLLPRLERGLMLLPRPARNRLPLIHVRDAARAIVHLAGLGPSRLAGRSWILVDEEGGATLGQLFDLAADSMGVAPPRRVPRWLVSTLAGKILFETLVRDVRARPSELLATGFRFTYPTIREGVRATLDALGYSRERGLARRERAGRRRWLTVLAATLGAVAFVNAFDFPLGVRRLRELAHGEQILDMRPRYTSAEAYHLLEALGPEGRARYLRMLWTVDLAMPALFSIFLWTAVSRGALRRWRSVTLAAGAADYLENVAISALLLAYPARHDTVASLGGALTTSKLVLYAAGLGLAAWGGWLGRRSGARVRAACGRKTP